ncbi:MAG: superoxide dismutase, Ni, partial [Parcubacteria group bacterium]|nr:superoxide dismutase, Ni [Parcubacteria group bacterium]
MFSSFIVSILKRMRLRQVWAHCDIPCGIYTADPAVVAARTCLKMVEKILNLLPAEEKSVDAVRNFHNAMTRYVLVKEQHAQKCKEELLILWTDYCKPEHLAMFPDLHEKFWKAAKLCSRAKQEVSLEGARALLAA